MLVKRSFIQVNGTIWMPAVTASTQYELSSYDIGNMRGEDGTITRENVSSWLDTHSGDFQSVDDFYATIEDGDNSYEFEWSDPESELTFNGNMYGDE